MDDIRLFQKLAPIRLVAMDVDGVLTDGGVILNGSAEWKSFHARDGLGIVLLRESGLEVAWITARESASVARRAAELGVTRVHQKQAGKLACLQAIAAELELRPEGVLYMGDDLPDLPCLQWAGVSVAPADASPDVRSRVDLVTHAQGGHGAVREMAELLLKARNAWPQLLGRYLDS
ncbi:HAD hydrolase family protein [Candidatus Poribacteria bacterium]|nr:HAD hydrolase family protein [Candidatus Poribacteria bacterium]